MEVAMLLGLAALGYSLSTPGQEKLEPKRARKIDPIETFVNPQEQETDRVTVVQAATGHNNMVPYFGSKVTQSTYNGATDGILDTYTGAGKHTFFHKDELPAMFKPEQATGLPFGRQVETDFEQSRMVTSQRLNNVFPIQPTLVGPGINDGYTNLPSGGFQQDAMREYALPKTTDEIRAANKPKITYAGEIVPGSAPIKNMGIQAPVKKNRPDRFQIMSAEDGSMPHLNTTTGAQPGHALYPEQVMKVQNRETSSAQQFGAATAAAGGFLSYIRSFTEPYQEFMKLTVEGRPTPAGPGQGGGTMPSGMNVVTNRDESVFNNVRGFEAPLYGVGGQIPTADLMGSVKYTEPLQQDQNMERMEPGLLDAFRSNPYTQSLQSSS